MKAIEQYFPVVLFIMLYKMVLTFESVDEILKCDHSNESYWAALPISAVYYAVQGDSNLIHIKAIKLFFRLCHTRRSLLLSLWTKSWIATIQMNAAEQ